MKIRKTLFLLVCVGFIFSACKENTKQENDNTGFKNETMKNILNRSSVREYSNKEISKEIMQDLLRAGMAAPSSKDRRPWHLIVISDKSILENLGNQLKNASMLKNANKAIIVCGDTILSDNNWSIDCSAVTENILLAAESMGIGAVWTAVYPYPDREAVVNETFQLPKNIRALAIIPLGYPVGKSSPKDKFDETRIHTNKW